MSNPHDRSGAFHSYEIYAKDSSGNVSFWQGWEFVGYPEHRTQRMARRNEQPGYDVFNGVTWPGRSQFIVSGPDLVDWKNFLRCEQWYKHAGLWSWDVSVTICGARTYYTVDEHLTDVANPATWHLTGDVGGAVSGPSACPAGYLPQFVADSFPKKGVYFETGNTAEKDFPTDGVTVPN